MHSYQPPTRPTGRNSHRKAVGSVQVQIVVMLVRETLPQDELEDLRDEFEGGLFGDVDSTLARLEELASEDPEWEIVSAVNVVDDEEEDDAPEE